MRDLEEDLKEKWTAKITAAIRTGFAGLGKGWYNTDETRMDVYLHSKLKRLLKRLSRRARKRKRRSGVWA